jgi:hypothetical protein
MFQNLLEFSKSSQLRSRQVTDAAEQAQPETEAAIDLGCDM